jgi:ferredoxin
MRIVVDRDLCESNGLCVAVCPDVFELDDHDRLVILIERPGEALRQALEHAVAACPRHALAIDESN